MRALDGAHGVSVMLPHGSANRVEAAELSPRILSISRISE
jgi:hypothetical protein